MQYVRSMSGAVSKTWNSINPATLSGAIDVIVVEHPDGTLACSPFHVRFGKFSLLRPSEKKVEFRVNGVKQDYAMKLGEGGEAFFVFETFAQVPEQLQTSPLVSPVSSPPTRPSSSSSDNLTADLEPLDLNSPTGKPTQINRRRTSGGTTAPLLSPDRRAQSDFGQASQLSKSLPNDHRPSPLLDPVASAPTDGDSRYQVRQQKLDTSNIRQDRSRSPPALPRNEAVSRALTLSKKLQNSNIPSTVNDEGDLMLDITGYKSSEEESLRAELVARQILSEELEGNYDIGSLIGADEKGNLWIYSSEEAKEAAAKKALFTGMEPVTSVSADAISDPGYHSSDETPFQTSLLGVSTTPKSRARRESDSAVGLSTPPDSPSSKSDSLPSNPEPSRSYAKTLRLTSDQLKNLGLKPGINPTSFSVNRATCSANMYLWQHSVPIVVSDVDGTITKSDALGHVLNMIGRDWTHLGVAKLYTEIVANGYAMIYLTSRSVGQADSTRTYLSGIQQDGGYRLPKGPVIMSPDRTIAALRREIYLRKPEVFKMACLRDIMSLFPYRKSPFYAGFGNRLTDALSYRSVNIPSTRIFTINSNAEVSLHLNSLSQYKTGYASMRETVDHFFPPTSLLVGEGGEEFTDFTYWRDNPRGLDEFSLTESDDTGGEQGPRRRDSVGSQDEDEDEEILSGDDEQLAESYISRDSVDGSSVLGSPAALSPAVTRKSFDSLAMAATRGSIEGRIAGKLAKEGDLEVEGEADELDLVAEATGARRSE